MEELIKLHDLMEKIQIIETRINVLRDGVERITQKIRDAVVKTALQDVLAKYVAELDALERKLGEKQAAYEEQSLLVDHLMAQIPEQQAKVLRFRHIQGLKWEDVADQVHYSVQHCKKINQVAIGTIEKIKSSAKIKIRRK